MPSLSSPPHRGLLDGESPDPYYRLAGFAQLTAGGSAGGDLGAGVAGAVGGLGCDAVAGSVQGRVRPAAAPALVGEATWSVCASRAWFTLAFDGHKAIGLAPAIDARRSLWSRRYDQTYRRVNFGLGEMGLPGRPHRHSFVMMSFGHAATIQSDGVDRRDIVELDLDVALYRYRHVTADRELAIDVLAVTSDSIKAGTSNKGAVTLAILPARARFATPELYVAAEGGIGTTGGKARETTTTMIDDKFVDTWDEAIDGDGLPRLEAFVGSATGGFVRRQLDARATLSRGFYPTFDGNLALEDRLAGSITWADPERQLRSLTLSPFVAYTHTWTRDAGSGRSIGVGASLHAGYALGDVLRLDAIGEAGVTPYARLDGDRLADRLGGQLLVALSAGLQR